MDRKLSGLFLAITILSAACGGNASSPLSPSGNPPSSAPSTTGATVLGTVRLGLTAPVVGSSADPMRVEVVGTPIVSTVSAAGQFELGNIPPGQVRLRFFGAGADASVTISAVVSGETVTITVTVVGTSAVINSESRSTQGQAKQEIEGRVESLPPTQPAGTLVVAGRTITTDAQTVIRQGSLTKTFADLQIGQRVHVRALVSGTALLASIIEIQNTQTDLPVEINGVVSGLTGTELAFQFTVNGRLIKGDNLTIFYGNSTFADLKNGVRVEVKGQQQDAIVYAARIHVEDEEDDDDEGEDDDDDEDDNGQPGSIKLEGALSGLTGTCPAVSFTLSGKLVSTNISTMYKGMSCSTLANSLEIEVMGKIQSNGTVLATKIERD